MISEQQEQTQTEHSLLHIYNDTGRNTTQSVNSRYSQHSKKINKDDT